MKRLLLIVAVLATGLCPVAMTGCCGTQLKTLADGVDSGTAEVFKEYEAIVIDGKPRPAFNDSDKEIRRGSLKKVRELLDQARK
jgi:hypothetical protein